MAAGSPNIMVLPFFTQGFTFRVGREHLRAEEEQRAHELPQEIVEWIGKKIETNASGALANDGSLEEYIKEHLPQVFDFRLEMLRLVIDNKIDLLKYSELGIEALKEAYGSANDELILELIENLIFTFKTTIKISGSISSNFQGTLEEFAHGLVQMDYKQMKFAIQLEPLPRALKGLISKFVDTSLCLEYAVLLGAYFIVEPSKYAHEKIRDLSCLLRDWTQEYGAQAMELKLWSPECDKNLRRGSGSVSDEDIHLEQKLADTGISDYLDQILKEEQS